MFFLFNYTHPFSGLTAFAFKKNGLKDFLINKTS